MYLLIIDGKFWCAFFLFEMEEPFAHLSFASCIPDEV
jgi:hypothetical protein